MNYEFKPDFKTISKVNGIRNISDLSNEISVYAASPDFVRNNCGSIAIELLNKVPEWYFEKCRNLKMLPNIDIRVHRLNKGEYPAVPGWHCDGSLRETYFSQPEQGRVKIRDTIIGFVSSVENLSSTEVFNEPLSLDIKKDGDEFSFWKKVHDKVPKGETVNLKDGDITLMSCETLHKCTPAQKRGWRLFFRMSMWHNDYLGEQGKISTQQQVYILNEGNGW